MGSIPINPNPQVGIPTLDEILKQVAGNDPLITNQPQLSMPNIPKPMMADPVPGYSMPDGSTHMSQDGYKKANTFNAISGLANTVGKYTNKKKEDKYVQLQSDMERIMTATAANQTIQAGAQGGKLTPEQQAVVDKNNKMIEGIMNGKTGKDIQKALQIDPINGPKDPLAHKALIGAKQSSDKKQGFMQKVTGLLHKNQNGGGGQPPMSENMPGGGSGVMPGLENIPGATNMGTGGGNKITPNPIAKPQGTPPFVGNGSSNSGGQPNPLSARETGSKVSSPTSGNNTIAAAPRNWANDIATKFPIVPGVNPEVTLKFKLYGEAIKAGMIPDANHLLEYQRQMTEEAGRNTRAGDVNKSREKVGEMLAKSREAVESIRVKGNLELEVQRHKDRMAEINAKHKAVMKELDPVKQMTLMKELGGQMKDAYKAGATMMPVLVKKRDTVQQELTSLQHKKVALYAGIGVAGLIFSGGINDQIKQKERELTEANQNIYKLGQSLNDQLEGLMNLPNAGKAVTVEGIVHGEHGNETADEVQDNISRETASPEQVGDEYDKFLTEAYKDEQQ